MPANIAENALGIRMRLVPMGTLAGIAALLKCFPYLESMFAKDGPQV
jgi:hypothetical protein